MAEVEVLSTSPFGNTKEMEPFMTPMNASSLSGSVLRYGNPVVDCDGAWMRALSRQLANVVTVGGSVSAENLDKLTAYVKRFIMDEKPFVLDLSAVDSIAAQADQLLDAVGEACEKAGVEWAMVAGDVVTEVLGGAMPARESADAPLPVVDSVPDALDHFADANLRRRTMLLPLLATKLTRSA